ncbi:glycosyltransferase involved in cell wall biosynthesis [Paenibacillus phyllosphaerae]|uniref:Glycosyltransferase involved in cell wall biosynthesis n=1 Tax=Paenibacillus phyllosphaerae TaxID=274593 RepID=A0A7W5B1U6_9BACL|nr:glycosyltransferase [Paenibacillus phyllosphaerae]MBB3112895.1 glycosyltransferase involved in cell wall biosynthesis [Paenibacillus phyllosphaerae]
MEQILWLLTAGLALQLMFTVFNLSSLPKLGGTGHGSRWLAPAGNDGGMAPEAYSAGARLSVLIPARDEAYHIGDCLASVLQETSPWLEVIVLDDRSTDGTGRIARGLYGHDPRLRVLTGKTPPDGWIGKAFACHQLSEAARGKWWLFLDADARLAPGALARAMDTALQQGSGLVTGFPHQVTRTWLERLIVPLMQVTIALHLPIRLVRHSRNPDFVAAHGAFMLVHRDSYLACGGHAAHPDHLVDDMALAREMKRSGYPVTLADLERHVSMRMYRDAAGVWNGFKKNIYAGVGRKWWLLLAVCLLYTVLFVLPPALTLLLPLLKVWPGAGKGMVLEAAWIPAAASWLLGIAIKLAVDRKHGQPFWYAALLAPGVVLLSAIAWASWRGAASKRGYVWKGRKVH